MTVSCHNLCLVFLDFLDPVAESDLFWLAACLESRAVRRCVGSVWSKQNMHGQFRGISVCALSITNFPYSAYLSTSWWPNFFHVPLLAVR